MNYSEIQQKIYKLIDSLDAITGLWAKAKADKNYSDEMKKVSLGIAKSASEAKSESAREREAYASPEYKDYLMKAFRVDCEFYELDANKSKIEKELDAMRSLLSFERDQINRTI